MQINTVETLEWDSQFFGYRVARIILDKEGCDIINSVFQLLKSEKFRLTYFFVPPEEKELNGFISNRGSILVDQKATFSKPTEKHDKFSNSIVEYQEAEINETLIELVLQAGLFSRFCMDKNFKNKEYERLYVEWLTKSINKTIAFKTLVAKRDTDIIGLTTLGDKADYADIGLVAVDRNFRGQGIGYDLIQTADAIACDMEFKEIKVVTQLKNKGACRLYEKCNFHIECITNIYHYWQ